LHQLIESGFAIVRQRRHQHPRLGHDLLVRIGAAGVLVSEVQDVEFRLLRRRFRPHRGRSHELRIAIEAELVIPPHQLGDPIPVIGPEVGANPVA